MKINVLKNNDHRYNPLKKQQPPALLSRQCSHIINNYNKSTNVAVLKSFLAGGKDFYDLVTVKSLAPTFQFYNETLK